jgi:hypothetical protein
MDDLWLQWESISFPELRQKENFLPARKLPEK